MYAISVMQLYRPGQGGGVVGYQDISFPSPGIPIYLRNAKTLKTIA